ncbi:hypothetical protein Pfo_022976 [Paulownia fortunei]|nr:hypothetical protein Pfo_022976 [Paulownia fortunei]
MAVDGKEDNSEKAQTEVSQEPKLSENVKEDEVVLKEDVKVGEGNGETKKVEEENGKKNVSEKGEHSLPLFDGNEKEHAKESEKGTCSSPLSEGNEKENAKESEKEECSLPLSDANEKENAKESEKDEYSLPLSDGNVKESEKGECSLPPSDGSTEENRKESEKGECSSSPSDAKGRESSLVSEGNGLLSDLTEYEKKALRELRSRVEEAILMNKLFKEVKKVEKKEVSQKENFSEEKEESKKVVEEKEKQEKSVDDGGNIADKGKAKVEEEEEKSDEGKKVEIEVEVDKGIALWGVPLLPSKGDKGTDVLLFKFLKAREFKANDAFEMLKNTLEWRKENKIDSILEEDFGNDYDSVGYMRGLDREGHPVCYNVYGVFADEEMYNKTFGTEASREKFLRWRLQLLEKEIQKLDFRPGGISSLLQINDLKNTPGPSRRDLRLATKRAVGTLQDNYPEFVARNIFINVPFWYYAFNALLSPFLTQRTKSKFVFSRPARVTETLLKYVAAEEVPVLYGGLRRENDPDFSTQDAASEVNVKAGATETIDIPAPEAGNTLIWDLTIIGWDVNYKEEFVPTDEGSYTVIVKKGRKISWQQESIRNSFKNKEPGKVVITIENGMFRKKRVLYRYKTKNHSASS